MRKLAILLAFAAWYYRVTIVRSLIMFDDDMALEWDYPKGSIVTATYPKTGQTWTIATLMALETGGDESVAKRIMQLVPWPERVWWAGETRAEHRALYTEKAVFRGNPVVHKTHVLPPKLTPLIRSRPDLKFVAVWRDPEDTAVSWYNFIRSWDLDLIVQEFKLFRLMLLSMPDPSQMTFPDWLEASHLTESSYQAAKFVPPGMPLYAESLRDWWPLKDLPNVLWIHYRDLRTDFRATCEKLAEFCGIDVAWERDWEQIAKVTSFKWMKANVKVSEQLPKGAINQFRQHNSSNPPMFTRGALGGNDDMWSQGGRDGAALRADFRRRLSAILTPEMMHYAYNGTFLK